MTAISNVVGVTPVGGAVSTPIKNAAREFEAIFLRQMIASMRGPSLGEDLFGSDASNQFRDMSDARLADSMAGKFGIATMLERQLTK